jgi:hypothetical protein
MNICIFASDLAVITGHNTYKDVSEIILKLWQKNFPEDYDRVVNQQGVKVESTDEYIDRISKENKIDIKAQMKECLSTGDVREMNKKKNEIIKKFSAISEKERKLVQDCIKEKTNTDFGTRHENSGLKKYMKDYNDTVKKVDTFFKRHLFDTENHWYVGGKIDGINTDSVLIEVKNRMNRLFYKLRDYEKVQVYAYLYILELDKAKLVECFKQRDSCNINVIDIDFEIDFWGSEILSKINSFVAVFEDFLKNEEKKQELVNILFGT